MMHVSAQGLLRLVFAELVSKVESGAIRPGSRAERVFLRNHAEQALGRLLHVSGFESICPKVSVVVDLLGDPEEVKIQVDDVTVNALKSVGKWSD